MRYDFDQPIDRQGTGSVKWEFYQNGKTLVHCDHSDYHCRADRLLPLWVADMDFPGPKPVVDAVSARAAQGLYGYTAVSDGYYEAIINWMQRRQGWQVQKEWICLTPGVVPALNLLVRTLVQPGQSVLVQQPVYYPFFKAIENNGGQIVSNSLVLENGRYSMDFEDLERKAADPGVTLAILCNPHNPVGRVWHPDELRRFGEICRRNDVVVISDEIHGDLIHQGHTFTPYAGLGESFSGTVVCTAASKTFNLAGLQLSNIIIPDAELRERFCDTLKRSGLYGTGVFGPVATEAAYRHGGEWLDQVMAYIGENRDFLGRYVAAKLPGLKLIEPEGTYLAWVDCRGLDLSPETLQDRVLGQAGVYLDEGYIFGPEGAGFQRWNLACTRAILTEALDRIRKHLLS